MEPLIACTVLIGIVFAAGALWLRARNEALRHEHEKRGTWRRSAPTELIDGEIVRVVGIARRTDSDLEAPLSGRRVLAFVAVVHSVSGWPFDRLLVTAQDVVGFDIELGNGRVHVRGGAHRLGLERRSEGERSGWWFASSRAEAFVEKCGRSTRSVFDLPRRLRWIERTLEDGDEVVVIGLARRVALASGAIDYRSSAADVHIVEPPDDRVSLGSAWLI